VTHVLVAVNGDEKWSCTRSRRHQQLMLCLTSLPAGLSAISVVLPDPEVSRGIMMTHRSREVS
jgi:hypothetical protein